LGVSLLGRFEVSVASRVAGEEGWRLRKAASLVKPLALAPYHRLHREPAMKLLRSDLAPRSAANNLHQALHGARRILCPDGALRVDVHALVIMRSPAPTSRRRGRTGRWPRSGTRCR
jgi:DNA-binding SARP family transcriptional activator